MATNMDILKADWAALEMAVTAFYDDMGDKAREFTAQAVRADFDRRMNLLVLLDAHAGRPVIDILRDVAQIYSWVAWLDTRSPIYCRSWVNDMVRGALWSAMNALGRGGFYIPRAVGFYEAQRRKHLMGLLVRK